MVNPTIKYGLYAGVIVVVLDLILVLISDKAYLYASGWIAAPIVIGAMIMASKEYKVANEGYASFGEIFKASWLTYLVTGLITTIFGYILFKFISPSLVESTMQIAMESMDKMKGIIGEEGYEKAMEQMEQNDPLSPFNQLTGLLTKYVMAAIPALIIGLVMKNKRNEFA